MKRLILGIVIVVLGIGGCFVSPFIGIMGMLTQGQSYFSNQEGYRLTVEQADDYKLYLVTSGFINGQRVTANQSDLPAGMYGGQMPEDKVIPLATGMNETLSINNVDMQSLGQARLTPGVYNVVVPESDQTFYFLATSFGVADMFIGFGIGLAIMAVGLVVGLILIITGVMAMSRKKRQQEPA